ncbi:MAG TPA: hypothetical protein P5549_06425 [Syntrophomonas sp.]|mgnify:CR=1 FL=1|nr:hypothetical protein [Syntrophomonas sp.]
MRNILQRWKELPRDDLFTFWQEEVQLRKELRQARCEYRELAIESKEQYDFLRLGLAYGGHRTAFLQILFYNMDSQTVQNQLLQGPLPLYQAFLRFLPRIITAEKPSSQRLQFLISLYREDFAQEYQEILANLEEEHCKYLLDRTANQSLRTMLKDKNAQHHQQRTQSHYGLLYRPTPSCPTLFGDKTALLKQTVQRLATPPIDHRENLFLALGYDLESAEQLFMLGMLEECLALQHFVYQQWTTGRSELSVEDDALLFKAISRNLAKSLSLYALISNAMPYRYSASLYHRYYPEIPADKNAQAYLHLYQSLQTSHDSNPEYTMIELAHICRQHGLNEVIQWVSSLIDHAVADEPTVASLLAEIDRDLTAMPHRALTNMRLLLFGARHRKIVPTRSWAGKLLQNHLSLFQWFPAASFLNQSIYEQLSASVEDEQQKEADRLWLIASQYTRGSIRELYQQQTERFKNENNPILQQLLLGSFLGVK